MNEDKQYMYKYVIPNDLLRYGEEEELRYIEHYENHARHVIGEKLFDIVKSTNDGVCFWLKRDVRPDYKTLYNEMWYEPFQKIVEYRVDVEVVRYHNPIKYMTPDFDVLPIDVRAMTKGELSKTNLKEIGNELLNRLSMCWSDNSPFSVKYNQELIVRARKEL